MDDGWMDEGWMPEGLSEAEERTIREEVSQLAHDLARADGQQWDNLPYSARDHYRAEARAELCRAS